MVTPSFSLTELATDYAQTRDASAREKVVEAAQPYVKSIAGYLFERFWKRVEFDDMVSDGNIGLLEAVDRYNPALAKFETYMHKRVEGSIYDGLRRRDFLKRSARIALKKMKVFVEKFKGENLVNPEKEDFRKAWVEAGYSPKMFEDFYFGVFLRRQEEGVTGQLGENNEQSFDGNFAERDIDFRDLFDKDLSELPDAHRAIFRAYILDDTTVEKAAGMVGLTGSRATQLKKYYFGPSGFFRRAKEQFGASVV